MHALLYRSSATHPLTGADFSAIRAASTIRNGLWGVTSLLLCGFEPSSGRPGFVQWIEGEREAVESLFAHVRSDPRHRDVARIASGDSLRAATQGRRLFDGWAMEISHGPTLPGTVAEFLGTLPAVRAAAT